MDNAVTVDVTYIYHLTPCNFLTQAGILYFVINMATKISYSKQFLKFALSPGKYYEIMRKFFSTRQEIDYIIHVMRRMVLCAGYLTLPPTLKHMDITYC
jgi:hypothetical protein